MSDRDKMIELISYFCEHMPHMDGQTWEEACADHLLANGVTVGKDADVPTKWIPVGERLPNVNRTKSGYESLTVIATDGKNVRPMIYERACVKSKVKFRWKWMWGRIYDGAPIVAWQPLPEPPKGVQG